MEDIDFLRLKVISALQVMNMKRHHLRETEERRVLDR